MATWLIKDAMDDAARECSITPPASWLSATGSNELQFRTFLKDTARELLQRHAWGAVSTDTSFTGAASSFTLPDDFLRVHPDENAVFETAPNRRIVKPIPVRGDWTEITEWNWTGAQRYYRLRGGTIDFLAALPASGVVKMAYLKTKWLQSSGGTAKALWDDIADVSLIPGHLLQLGVTWRWRRHKGIVYADRRAEFESEFARAAGDDGPRRKVDFSGDNGTFRNPFDMPVPDFIPSA
jgi:hypothetical protein